MTLEEATQKIQSIAQNHGGKLKARTNFQFDEGTIHLDDTQEPTLVSNEKAEADCTLIMTLANFEKILCGDMNPMMAFMTGKMKIEGDKGAAMKLSSLF
ncbi:MAG: putative sterol carrier protein [Cyclobacteriaceae bacterium]|jgi:putative sterol carrier protein